jgi:hypothetical protein
MSKQWLSIEFNDLDGAAFEGEDMGPELGRILRALAARLETMSREEFVNDDADCKLKDINGNTVGSVSGTFYEDEDEDEEQELYDSVRTHTKWMSHHEIAKFLEDCCNIAPGTGFTEADLVDAIVQSIKDGDTTIDTLEEFANKS